MTLTDQLSPLVEQLQDVLNQKSQLEDIERDLKARIRETVDGPDSYAAGDHVLIVTANNRFDAKRALQILPEALVPLVTYPETVIDKDKLRALAPDIYEQAQTVGDHRLSVKPA